MINLNMRDAAKYLDLRVGSFKTYIIKGLIPKNTGVIKNKFNQHQFVWSLKSLKGCNEKIVNYKRGSIVTKKELSLRKNTEKRVSKESQKETMLANLFNEFMGIHV